MFCRRTNVGGETTAQRVGLRSICSTFEFDSPTCDHHATTFSAIRLLGFSAIRLFGSRADVGGTANGPRAPPRAPSTRSGRIPWPADGPESATHEHATRTRTERPGTRRTASTATACTNLAPAGPNPLVRIHAPDASSKAIVEIDPRRADCAPPDPTAGAAGPAGRQTCYRHRPGREIRR